MSKNLSVRALRSKHLKNFADTDLALDVDYVKYGNKTANQIFDILRLSHSIDRVKISGSMGKQMSIRYPKEDFLGPNHHGYTSDYDLVVFWNWNGNSVDFFHQIPNLIADVLLEIDWIYRIKIVDICVQFETENGYHFDLVPAINFVPSSTVNHVQIQKQRTYKMMAKCPAQYRSKFSAGLAETVVEFAQNCDPFIHDLVRICKYWLYLQDIKRFYGMKALIETVAMKVGLSVLNNVSISESERLYCAFRTFLRYIKDFEKLNVVISSSKTYTRAGVPKAILEALPLVLDPANPSNNIAQSSQIDEEIIAHFNLAATYTLNKLDLIGKEDFHNILCDIEFQQTLKERRLYEKSLRNVEASCMDACSIV